MVTEMKPAVIQNTSVMTQAKATYLLKTVWPDAPDAEVIKASIICATYGLNPLLKQISIIKFEGKKGIQWVTVLGIKATRNIALGTGHKWSYMDGPRVMTEAEQITIFGQNYPDRIIGIVKIKDSDNNIYPGYGFFPKDGTIQGIDKGNTAANMAFIRAERNALDKMAPGQLPNTDVTDENYTSIDGNFKEVVEQGKSEAFAQAENDIDELWPQENVGITPENANKYDFDPDWLTSLLTEIHWTDKTTKSYLSQKYKVQTDGTIPEVVARLIKEQRAEFFKKIESQKVAA